MATYKTDRDRNYGFVGKFKFSYTVRFLTANLEENNFSGAQVLSGAFIIFEDGNQEEIGRCLVSRTFPDLGNSNWFGENADITSLNAPAFVLVGLGVKIPFHFKIRAGAGELRDTFILDNGSRLGDYIPFYFGTRTPMLYVIQKGFNGLTATHPEDIVYCVSSVKQIVNTGLDFIFTNGHAIDLLTTQFRQEDVANLDTLIDWDAVNATNWKSETDLDLKRRKQAEFLVLGDISTTAVLGFFVFNKQAYNRLLKINIQSDKIYVNNKHYFEL
jgi:hypothetical protein